MECKLSESLGWRLVCWSLLAAIVAVQALGIQSLFGRDDALDRIRDSRPIVDGRHLLHYYHGLLGARAWKLHGSTCCYDTSFQAGYPKTPIFDAGCRPAEVCILLGGENPAAYKAGLVLGCLLFPLLVAMAARTAGLGWGGMVWASAMGLLLFWGGPAQQLLKDGDADVLAASVAVLVQASMFNRYHLDARPANWIGLFASSAAAWLLHPLLAGGTTLLYFVLWLAIAPRHGFIWHIFLWSAWIAGAGLNFGWLVDCWRHGWVAQSPALAPGTSLAHSVSQWWSQYLSGNRLDVFPTIFVWAVAIVGLGVLLARKKCLTAATFGLLAMGFLATSIGAGRSALLAGLGAERLFVPAGIFAGVLAGAALGECPFMLHRITGHPVRAATLALALLGAMYYYGQSQGADLLQHLTHHRPFSLGLTREQLELADLLKTHTTADARILWDDGSGENRWTVMLPELTGRAFLGGLDPYAGVEHAFAGLRHGNLADRPIASWTDADLEAFCRRYNVGWVVSWTPAVEARLRAWSAISEVAALNHGGRGRLFAVNRAPAFVIKGKAQVDQADWRRVALSNVEPENGEIVLSLHHHAGWRVVPNTVRVERDPDPYDPIPMLRLRLPGPIMRLTLTWEGK